uniref:Tim44 domain-containing protein n=1 Tax=Panagrellus redivivus TaxID=6233 RepID=A0A7E4VS32_PANRE
MAATQATKPLWRRAQARVVEYVKNLINDYKTVAIESIEDAPKHPLRTVAFLGTVTGITTAVVMNPTERQMLDRLAEWRLQMGLVPNSIHSTLADKTLVERTDLLNSNRYDYFNCVLFSLVVRRRYDTKARLYASQDSNLKDWPWNEIFKNVIDIGAFGRFWMLEQKFVDYDIKVEEFNESTAKAPKTG